MSLLVKLFYALQFQLGLSERLLLFASEGREFLNIVFVGTAETRRVRVQLLVSMGFFRSFIQNIYTVEAKVKLKK